MYFEGKDVATHLQHLHPALDFGAFALVFLASGLSISTTFSPCKGLSNFEVDIVGQVRSENISLRQ
jgi:hypothetical protein